MSWSDPEHKRSRRGYHHGNLRSALIDAALQLIADRGPEGVTLAEAARMAGVSPAAPYRHFKDRTTLMTAVARVGFKRFTKALGAAVQNEQGTPLQRLNAIGRAYLGFARAEPALYAAMFEAGIALNDDAELRRDADEAFDILQSACTEIHKSLPADRRAPPLMMALHIWAFSHGIASLFARGDGARRPTPVSAEELMEAGVLIYLDGLGIKR